MARSNKNNKKAPSFFSKIGMMGGENQNMDSSSVNMANDKNKARRSGKKVGSR